MGKSEQWSQGLKSFQKQMKILCVRNNLKWLHYALTLLQAEALFWEGAITIQPSKGRDSLFLGISYWHHR